MKNLAALRLLPNETTLETVTVTRGDNGSTLKSLYELLECERVDVIRLTSDIDVWVDDEGLLVSEPQPNMVLTLMLVAFGIPNNHVFGAGVFLGVNSRTGETVGLTDRQVNILRNAHHQALLM